ncbi:MAG: transposase [Ruminiclostridium sp.]
MGSNKQKRYDEKFKTSAVKMIIEKGIDVSEVSKSLDVSKSAIRRWVEASREPENSQNSRIKELEAELKKLKKENDDLKDTVNVLKKSIAIFV